MAHKNTNWVEETLKQKTAPATWVCPNCGYEQEEKGKCPECGAGLDKKEE